MKDTMMDIEVNRKLGECIQKSTDDMLQSFIISEKLESLYGYNSGDNHSSRNKLATEIIKIIKEIKKEINQDNIKLYELSRQILWVSTSDFPTLNLSIYARKTEENKYGLRNILTIYIILRYISNTNELLEKIRKEIYKHCMRFINCNDTWYRREILEFKS